MDRIVNFMTDFGSAIVSWFRGLFDVTSPSLVERKFWENIEVSQFQYEAAAINFDGLAAISRRSLLFYNERVPCQYCGQSGEPMTVCEHCGGDVSSEK